MVKLLNLQNKFSLLLSKYIFKGFLSGFNVCAFFSNIKLENLQITVLKQWNDLSKILKFLKENFHCYRPNVFSKVLSMGFTINNLWNMLSAFLPKIKLEQLQPTILKSSRDLGKNITICKISFHYSRPNIFSKLSSMVHWF